MKMRRVLIPIGLAVAGTVAGLLILRDDGDQGILSASGTVEATEARLGFSTAGRITEIEVREGDSVRAGAELARLDASEPLARRAQAQAQADGARALLDELERGSRNEEVAQARAARDAAHQRLEDAARDLERVQRLREGGAVSAEALDKAVLAHDIARSQSIQADEQARLVESGPRPERIEAQRAQLAQAQAAVAVIDAALANLTIRAACDGIVTVRHHEPGEIVAAGVPVLTIMNPADRWVRIFVPETRVTAVRLGMPAEIRVDAFPRKAYGGEVTFLASEAEFTPKSVQTKEERVKLVYAVKVAVTGDPEGDLKPGQPADVRLTVSARSGERP
jgi:HlyD family secretion protein